MKMTSTRVQLNTTTPVRVARANQGRGRFCIVASLNTVAATIFVSFVSGGDEFTFMVSPAAGSIQFIDLPVGDGEVYLRSSVATEVVVVEGTGSNNAW